MMWSQRALSNMYLTLLSWKMRWVSALMTICSTTRVHFSSVQLTCGVRKYWSYMNSNWAHLQFHIAITLSTNEWKGKKVVLISVPGAFTVRWCLPIILSATLSLLPASLSYQPSSSFPQEPWRVESQGGRYHCRYRCKWSFCDERLGSCWRSQG